MRQMFDPQALPVRRLKISACGDAQLVRRLIGEWHSFRKAPGSNWKVAFVLVDSLHIYGVSIFAHPVARNEDQTGTLEHSRMALSPDAPRNSASYFMAQSRKWIKANMPGIKRLIAYVPSEIHTGITYRADGWRTVYSHRSESGKWTTRRKVNHGCLIRTKFEREP